jgi:hypothetical protein
MNIDSQALASNASIRQECKVSVIVHPKGTKHTIVHWHTCYCLSLLTSLKLRLEPASEHALGHARTHASADDGALSAIMRMRIVARASAKDSTTHGHKVHRRQPTMSMVSARTTLTTTSHCASLLINAYRHCDLLGPGSSATHQDSSLPILPLHAPMSGEAEVVYSRPLRFSQALLGAREGYGLARHTVLDGVASTCAAAATPRELAAAAAGPRWPQTQRPRAGKPRRRPQMRSGPSATPPGPGADKPRAGHEQTSRRGACARHSCAHAGRATNLVTRTDVHQEHSAVLN